MAGKREVEKKNSRKWNKKGKKEKEKETKKKNEKTEKNHMMINKVDKEEENTVIQFLR